MLIHNDDKVSVRQVLLEINKMLKLGDLFESFSDGLSLVSYVNANSI